MSHLGEFYKNIYIYIVYLFIYIYLVLINRIVYKYDLF